MNVTSVLLRPEVSVTQGCRWWAWLAVRGRHTLIAAATLSGRGAQVYTADCTQGWLGVVTGISAASTGGVLVCKINTTFEYSSASLRRSGMACVNEGSQPHVRPHFHIIGMNNACVYSPVAENHRPLAGSLKV